MNGVSFSISGPTLPLSQVEDVNQAKQAGKSERTLTVTVSGGALASDRVGGGSGITLTYPLVTPDGVGFEKVLQQLKEMDLKSPQGMTLSAAVLQINQAVGEVAAGMIKGGKAFVEKNAEQLGKFFGGVEQQGKKAETQLFDLISKSSYPDFNSFLSKMLVAAQELRALASEAKHHLSLGQFHNTMDVAKQMEIAAEKNYQSTMKEIKAAQMEAIGKIISGVVTIGAMGAGAGLGRMGSMGGLQGAAMFGSPLGQAFGNIIEGSTGLMAGGERMDGAALKKEADLAGALQKKLEATGKLLQDAEQMTDELRDIAKTLADSMLKMQADFMANQHQIIQRANI